MTALEQRLLHHCREILLRTKEFESNETLRSVFVTKELEIFSDSLPEAINKAQRVDLLINYLLPKKLRDGQQVFPVFIEHLRDRYSLGDSQRDDLENLYKEIISAMKFYASAQEFLTEVHETVSGEMPQKAQFPKQELITIKSAVDFDHQGSEYSNGDQKQEIHALITQANKLLEDQLAVFMSGGEIYSDQCENAITAVDDIDRVINTDLAMTLSQYKTLMPVIHLQQSLKTIKDLLVEFKKTCPPGNSYNRVKISGQIEKIKNSLSYLENTILNGP